MSREYTAISAAQRVGTVRQQASLRDHLNERVAPFLKTALIKSLDNDVEYPLQWLGEYLINQSILHEGNPDTTNIKAHFKYDFDLPAPEPEAFTPAASATDNIDLPSLAASTLQDAPMMNGTSSELPLQHPAYVNGDSSTLVAEIPTAIKTEGTHSAEEMLPSISQAATEDTDMQGTS